MSKLAEAVGAEDHVQGSEKAAVTLVEYGDYQCPDCGRAAAIVKKVERHFGGKLRFCFRNYPLPQHPFAEAAAETAEWAATHGTFWEMHDALFHNQTNFEDELFPELAKELGMHWDELDKVLADGTMKKRVQRDVKSGDASGLQGTPTFYVNGAMHNGAYDFESLVAAIEKAMR